MAMKRIRFEDECRPTETTEDDNFDDRGSLSSPDYSCSDGGSVRRASDENDFPPDESPRSFHPAADREDDDVYPMRHLPLPHQDWSNNDSQDQMLPDYDDGESMNSRDSISELRFPRAYDWGEDQTDPDVDYPTRDEEWVDTCSPDYPREFYHGDSVTPGDVPDGNVRRRTAAGRAENVEYPSYTLQRAMREAKQMGLQPTDEMGNNILPEMETSFILAGPSSSARDVTASRPPAPSERECWARHCRSKGYHAHPKFPNRSHGEDDEREDRSQLQAKYGVIQRSLPSSQEKNKTWEQFKDFVRGTLTSLVIWRQPVKRIEGHFGTSTASYFRLIRWLLSLNVIMFLVVFIFISLPQILVRYDVVGNRTVAKESHCHQEYIDSTKVDDEVYSPVLDFLQGMGWMENTVLFIGYYENVVISFRGMQYNIPLAYICVVLCILVYSLFRMLWTVARGIKEGVIVSEGELQNYCNTVFAGWQFCISKPDAAELRKEMLTTELMGYNENDKLKIMLKARTKKEKAKLYLIRIVIFLFIFAALGAGCYGIYKASDFSLQNIQTNQNKTSTNKVESFAIQYLPSITITLMNLAMPIIFDFLIVQMKFSPIYEIKVKIGSTVGLRLASIAVLLGSFYSQIHILDPETCGRCKVDESCNIIPCWENYIGRQIYKLVLLDFIIVMLMIFCFNFLRMLLVKNVKLKFVQWIGENEFDISQHVLELIYSQTLCWLGVFFSPLLPLVCIIKFVIFFYAKRFDLVINCAATRQAFRVSKSNSFFMLILLLSYGVLVFLPLAYFLSVFPPSRGCSPFRSNSGSIWHTIPDVVQTWPFDLQRIIDILTSSIVAIPVIIIVLTVIFYYYTIAAAYKKMSNILKEYLVLEGKDKQFLLRRYQEVTTRLRRQQSLTDAKNAHVRRRRLSSSLSQQQ